MSLSDWEHSKGKKKFKTAEEAKQEANALFNFKTCRAPGCKHTSKRYKFTDGLCQPCHSDPKKVEAAERAENEREASTERRKAVQEGIWGTFA